MLPKLAYVLPAGGPKGYGIGLVHDLMAGVLSGDGATLIKGALEPRETGAAGQSVLPNHRRGRVPAAG